MRQTSGGLETGDASSWLLVWLQHWGGGGESISEISIPACTENISSLGPTTTGRVNSDLNLPFRLSGCSGSWSFQLGIFRGEEVFGAMHEWGVTPGSPMEKDRVEGNGQESS